MVPFTFRICLSKRMTSRSSIRRATTGRSELDVERDYLKYISLQTKIEPEELADMVEFLASDKALKVTGELIAVSGNVEWEI